jgi:penicillin amidase
VRRAILLALLGVAVVMTFHWIRETWFAYPVTPISAGKERPAPRIVRDEFGIPTLEADEFRIETLEADDRAGLFEAQGYATASDRMFQMDWSRRQLLGQTAEVLGKSSIVRDFQTRALRVEACAAALYEQLSSEERAACTAYARGVNVWLQRHAGDLPAEFKRLGFRPRPWKATDCLAIWRGMAITLGDLTDDLDAERPRAVGSNGWAVAGTRTYSGRPLLAGDPHLFQSVPGAFHEVRFVWQGGGAVGWAIPGVPGLVMGRTRGVAFTPTAFSGDASDVFTFPLDAKNPKRFETRNGWLKTGATRPLVWLRLHGPLAIPVFWQAIETTPWGPVIGRQDGRLRTLRWSGMNPLPGEGLITVGTLDLESVDDARRLLRRQGLPDINVICADTTGSIAHFRVARLPRRVEHRTPRDAMDDSLEWHGTWEFDELPHEVDPPIGFVASGNGPPPAGGAYLGFDYLVPREKRIRERLATAIDWTPEGIHELQNDHVSEPARDECAARLATLDADSLSPAAAAILPALRAYDGRAEVDSIGPTIFRSWKSFGGGAAALNGAVAWLGRRLGPDPAGWRWGRIHQAVIRHALSDIDSSWNVPPFPRAGDRATIDVAGYTKFDTSAAFPAASTHGPAARWITDLSPGGATWAVLLAGESGLPESPHRLDQLEMWRTGALRKVPPPGEMPANPVSEEYLSGMPRYAPAPSYLGRESPNPRNR